MMKNETAGLKYILSGVIVFLLRYVPFFRYNEGIFDTRYSLDKASSLCNTFIGSFAKRCEWMQPLNVIVIIISIGLVGYGIYLFIRKSSKKNKNK